MITGAGSCVLAEVGSVGAKPRLHLPFKVIIVITISIKRLSSAGKE